MTHLHSRTETKKRWEKQQNNSNRSANCISRCTIGPRRLHNDDKTKTRGARFKIFYVPTTRSSEWTCTHIYSLSHIYAGSLARVNVYNARTLYSKHFLSRSLLLVFLYDKTRRRCIYELPANFAIYDFVLFFLKSLIVLYKIHEVYPYYVNFSSCQQLIAPTTRANITTQDAFYHLSVSFNFPSSQPTRPINLTLPPPRAFNPILYTAERRNEPLYCLIKRIEGNLSNLTSFARARLNRETSTAYYTTEIELMTRAFFHV